MFAGALGKEVHPFTSVIVAVHVVLGPMYGFAILKPDAIGLRRERFIGTPEQPEMFDKSGGAGLG